MTHYDLAIIGTGSGNSLLDEHYHDTTVAICEQGAFGGTCLNVGCIPTKMFVYTAEVAQSATESARYGVDAHLDGVRWPDIVSRIFGRIDPFSIGGENYRRSSPNVTVFTSPPGSGPQPDGRHTLRIDDADEFTADKSSSLPAHVPVVPDDRSRIRGAVPHQRHHHADRRAARHLVIVGGARRDANSPTSSRPWAAGSRW